LECMKDSQMSELSAEKTVRGSSIRKSLTTLSITSGVTLCVYRAVVVKSGPWIQ
jgi:hypothetical protein